jgi:CYTH domain-containing protein
MEIEKKYVIKNVPLQLCPYDYYDLEQAYISTNPVIRVRHLNDRYILTVKSKGLLAREEFEMDIDEEAYKKLLTKAEGNIISKRRYVIPLSAINKQPENQFLSDFSDLKLELDIFHGLFQGLIYGEVEFKSTSDAEAFVAPDWFSQDVTLNPAYHNSSLSNMTQEEIQSFLQKL